MRKRPSFIIDNRGGSLILVIVCISFISILCSILLSIAVNNIQMKSVDRKAKSNFYGAEIAFDEVKKGLEEIVADQLEVAYNQAMKKYIDQSEDEKKQIFSNAFLLGMIQELGTTERLGGTGDLSRTEESSRTEELLRTEDLSKYNLTLIKKFIKQKEATLITAEGENWLLTDTTSETNYITLKNISINYFDDNQYETTITSDIIIEVPKVSFNYSAASLRPTFSEYSLIADKMISLDTASHVLVNGNVYTGTTGIQIKNGSDLSISKASSIVTRGDINVIERSTLKIIDNPKIWARNIATDAISTTEYPTTIQIDGRIFIADDLMLNAANSNVTITGEYYGYSYDTYKKSAIDSSTKNASNSSAIIINGYKSSLDFSEINKLVIAGRAYLDPSSRGNDYKEEQGRVGTGESLAIKGNQLIYLVPSEYIWCGQNPVPIQTLNERPGDIKEVDFDKVAFNSKINLKEYLDDEIGYTKIVYQLGDKQNFVYYYLKFESEQKANQYLQKYYDVYNRGESVGIIDNNVKRFATSIKINPLTTRMSLGNVFTFDSETGKSMLYSNTIVPDAVNHVNLNALTQMASNLSDRYDAIKANLTEISLGEPYDKDSLFNTIIHYENIKKDEIKTTYTDGVKTVIIDSDYVIYIVDNEEKDFEIPKDDELPNNGRKGIVISTGSVRLNGEFTGLIIAKNKISLSSGASVNAPNGMLEEIFAANNPDVNRYFREYAAFSQESLESTRSKYGQINVADLIYYDRWRKNE